MAILSKFTRALKKTRDVLTWDVGSLVDTKVEVDPDLLNKLEEALILADVGPSLAIEIVDEVERRGQKGEFAAGELRAALIDAIAARLGDAEPELACPELEVIFAVGVNGVGKTTTLAKLAQRMTAAGRTPLLAAADTFRAAAAEQLEVWGERIDVPVVRHKSGADPAAVLYDALAAARSRGRSPVLVDTAGRLHNKKPLMDELSKLRRIASREVEGAPHQVLLVLDATIGSNGLNQAKEFQSAAGATAVVLTKLDGTAKGGIVLQIRQEMGLPVRWVGVGEGIDDLEPFDPKSFAEALF